MREFCLHSVIINVNGIEFQKGRTGVLQNYKTSEGRNFQRGVGDE